jgi:hypothetical protein
VNFYECIDTFPWRAIAWTMLFLFTGFAIGANAAYHLWKKQHGHWVELAGQLDKENTELLRDLAQKVKAAR